MDGCGLGGPTPVYDALLSLESLVLARLTASGMEDELRFSGPAVLEDGGRRGVNCELPMRVRISVRARGPAVDPNPNHPKSRQITSAAAGVFIQLRKAECCQVALITGHPISRFRPQEYKSIVRT